MGDVENDQTSEPTEPEWPLDPQLDRLERYDPADIEGQQRLGALAFPGAPRQVQEVIDTLRELRHEPWDRLDPDFASNVTGQVNTLLDTLETMQELTAADPNAQVTRNQLEAQLGTTHQWITQRVPPHALTARVNEILENRGASDAKPGSVDLQEERLRFRDLLTEVRQQREELEAQIADIAPVVEAGREVASGSAAVDLAVDYRTRAREHADAWRRWGVGLLFSIVSAAVGGVLVILWTDPGENASTSEVVGALALDVLVIGVLLYGLRMCSMQFRSHRHLEQVSLSKAAALSTFNRFVVGPADQEVRTALAQVLAQSVFATDETGLVDSSADSVTLIERVLTPVVNRAAS